MYELIILMIGVLVGYIWGLWNTTHRMLSKISEQPELFRELIDKLETMKDAETETGSEHTTPVTVEWQGSTVYLYQADGTFLAQADSITNAMELAKQRFPAMKFYLRLNDSKQSTQ